MAPEDLMRTNLIALAQTYASAKGWSLATVSKQIHGNQAFLGEYLAGNMSPTIRTYFSMIEKLRANWPKEPLVWVKVGKTWSAQGFTITRHEGSEQPYSLIVPGRRRAITFASLTEAKGYAGERTPEMAWPLTAPISKLGKKVETVKAAA